MIAGAQRAHLAALAFLGLGRDAIGPGAGHGAVFLGPLEVGRFAPALIDGPGRAAGQHGVHGVAIEADGAARADPGGNIAAQRIGQDFPHLGDVLGADPGRQGAHAAGNIEADAAGRHHAAGLGIEGGDAADGEAVAPMGVGHGIGGAHDAGQGRDIGDLLGDLVVHVADQRLIGVDHGGHPHLAGRRDDPGGGVLAGEAGGVHGAGRRA